MFAAVPSAGRGPDARHLVVERNLVRRAFEHLTVDAFLSLPFESLGPTKALLKRYFSLGPWGPADDEALARAVGPGEGSWQRALDDDLVLAYGWEDGRFSVRVTTTAVASPPAATSSRADASLAPTFDGPVVPEATPNPRTIRFRTGPIHDGPSRWYESAAKAADDPRARRLFGEFEGVANILVGPDFVAVSLRRGTDWEWLIAPVLQAVTEEFAPSGAGGSEATEEERVVGGPAGAGAPGAEARTGGRRASRLEQAWQELGPLRPADPAHLVAVQEAARGGDPFRRQVAANLLREADEDAAAAEWARLVTDPSRSVRRAVVDAIVDVGREPLRPLLETALGDTDPWVRWKALRGLVELGPAPSRDAIAGCADDPDFRVRLEVAAALRA
jgi:hypothetical protein